MTVPRGTMVGLHGTKRRWVEATLREGLRRPSAAWFELTAAEAGAVRATTIAAVHLALSPRMRRILERETEAGGYTRWFAAHPGDAPVLLLFRARGGEASDRYLVLSERPCLATAPYTKVQRAGLVVEADRMRPPLLAPTPGAIAAAERRSVAEAGAGEDTALLLRWPLGTPRESDLPVVRTKVARFCVELAAELEPYVAAALGGMREDAA